MAQVCRRGNCNDECYGTKNFANFYNNHRLGEIDFVIEHNGSVSPIEVKSGKDYYIHSALNKTSLQIVILKSKIRLYTIQCICAHLSAMKLNIQY